MYLPLLVASDILIKNLNESCLQTKKKIGIEPNILLWNWKQDLSAYSCGCPARQKGVAVNDTRRMPSHSWPLSASDVTCKERKRLR